MSYLDQLSQIAPIFSFITIILAIIFGISQLHLFKQQRKDLAAVEVMRTMQTSEFTDSMIAINDFKDGISRREIHDNHPETLSAILALTTKFETLGFLVYRKIIPIEFVEQLMGGECIRFYKKLSKYINDFRNEENASLFLEWYEWLVYQLKQRNRQNANSALDRFKNWKA